MQSLSCHLFDSLYLLCTLHCCLNLHYHPRLNPSTLIITFHLQDTAKPESKHTEHRKQLCFMEHVFSDTFICAYLLTIIIFLVHFSATHTQLPFSFLVFSTPLTQNSLFHTVTNGHHHLRLRVSPAQIGINTKFLHYHFHTQPQEQRIQTQIPVPNTQASYT